MRRLLVALALGASLLFAAQPATAAPVEKIAVCHLGGNGNYEYIEVPAQQFIWTKKLRTQGHARHAATGRDRLGLTEEECLGLNPGV